MADQAAAEKAVTNLHWLGHDCFRLDSSAGPIYFDPYELSGGPEARLILASHDHFDHCVSEDILKVQGPGSTVITEAACAAKLSGDVHSVRPGDVVELEDIRVQAVPAYNTDKDFHPKEKQWLGFVVTVDGVSIYHAGDSDHIPEMAALDVDIALLPVSGTYVMTAEQAVEAAKSIDPRVAIPMHYGAIVGSEDDARRFAAALEGVVAVKLLEKE